MPRRQNNRKNHAKQNRLGKPEEKKEIIEKKASYFAKYEEKKVQESIQNKYREKKEEEQPKAYKPIYYVEKAPQEKISNKNTKYREKDCKILESIIKKKVQELPEEKQDFQIVLNLKKMHQKKNKRKQNKFLNCSMLDEQRKDRIPSLQKQVLKPIENKVHKIFRKRMLDQQHPEEDQPEDSSLQQSSLNIPERQQQLEDILQKNNKKQYQREYILKTQRSEENNSEMAESRQEWIIPFHSLSQAQRIDFQSDQDEDQKMMRYFEEIEIQNLDEYIIYNLLDFEKPPNNIKIHPTFKDSEQYIQNLTILLKHQVLSNYRKELDLLVDQQARIIKIQVKIHQHKDRAYVTPIDDRGYIKDNQNQMKEAMKHGSTVGILTFSQDFKYEYLQDGRATLCYLTKKGKQIVLNGIDDTNIPTKPIRFINLGGSISYKRQLQAITQASQSQFIKMIIGKEKNSFKQDSRRKDHYDGNQIFQIMKDIRNQSQFRANKDIYLAEEGLFMIQGPPGTGKTSTISNLVAVEYDFFKSFRRDSKIVICSDSNAAINHVATIIMEKGLVGIAKMPKMVRLGHISEANRNLLKISLSQISQGELLRNHGKGNCKTPSQLKLQKENLSEKLNKCRLLSRRGDELHEIRKGYQRVMEQLQEVSDFVSEHQEQYDQIEKKHLVEAEIVLSTLNSCGKKSYLKILAGMCNIGCLIIDEAGQATQPSILIPFQIHPKKVVIVGDHKQLSPTTFSSNVEHTHYSRSMFQRFIQNGMRFYLLNTQYRMVPELSQFFNREFYEGKLKNCIIKEQPNFYRKMKKSLVFYDITYGQEKKVKKSFINQAEIQAILVFLKKLIKEDKLMTIGIISPYKPQAKELQERIEELNLPSYIADNIKISTIDSFQGQQKDIMIISTVSSNNKGRVGHIKDRKRLNVALSRCKFGMFVFGNTETLRANELLRRYIKYHENRQSLIVVNSKVEMQGIINSNFKGL